MANSQDNALKLNLFNSDNNNITNVNSIRKAGFDSLQNLSVNGNRVNEFGKMS